MKPKIAISIGDLSGVGIEIALRCHEEIIKEVEPIYCINKPLLTQAAKLLGCSIPNDLVTWDVEGSFLITPGILSVESGRYSYDSFMQAIKLAEEKKVDAIVTLPIHKEAWMMAGLEFKGHTDLLRHHFKKEAIMMLGCEEMFVSLYTEHIPLRQVAESITKKKLLHFLLDLHQNIGDERVAVLGLNPHAGDNGVLGNEESIIDEAIDEANEQIGKKLFVGSIVPDIAFTPNFRKNFQYFVAMYHDQGLAPLKALYFDESVNISLNLPIIRTSVDHGTAFDIAYQGKVKTLSYLNAIKSARAILNKK